MTEVKIITPTGMFGASASDDIIDTAMRVIGVGFGSEDEWSSKYGTNFENDVFMMHRFCWCDQEDGSCLWCLHGDHPDFHKLLAEKFGPGDYQRHADRHYYDPPQFWFKPTDFRLTWYKYIGRDMASNRDELPDDFLQQIFATHPTGMTAEQALQEMARREDESAKAFAAMFAQLGVKTA